MDFTKVNGLTDLALGKNMDVVQAISALPKKEKLRQLLIWKTPITEEDVALLSELLGLKDLGLYAAEEIDESSWLETLDLSKLKNLEKMRFDTFQLTKGLLLPSRSVKVYCNHKDSLKITYVK